MSVTAFPDYLALSHDYQLAVRPQPLRTQMEDGLSKQAQRYSLIPVERQLRYRLAPERLAEFRAWLATHHADWFSWPQPESGEVLTARIRGGEVTISPEFDAATDERPARYMVAFTLESWE